MNLHYSDIKCKFTIVAICLDLIHKFYPQKSDLVHTYTQNPQYIVDISTYHTNILRVLFLRKFTTLSNLTVYLFNIYISTVIFHKLRPKYLLQIIQRLLLMDSRSSLIDTYIKMLVKAGLILALSCLVHFE